MSTTLPQTHLTFVKRNTHAALYVSLLLVAFLALLDYVTGFEISLSFLYLIPIAFAMWHLSGQASNLVLLPSVGLFILSDWKTGGSTWEIMSFWNLFIHLTIFLLMVWLLQEFKRALAHERMLSQTDHLTGIANQREFHQQVQSELLRASRSKRPISLAYIDLDGFKQVNDRLGHRAGNTVLRTAAQAFQSTVRQTDLVARLGGDEFAILLPNTGQAGAKCIMQRLQAAFLKQMEAAQAQVTLSAGVISFLLPSASVDEMLHQADHLMYQAKAQGKNDILFWEF